MDSSRPSFLHPAPWIFPTRSIAIRLFITCWLVYSVHVATNTVREIYLALAIGDHFSFRVDDYANMHPDLFDKKGYGWHIGANPGASMLGAIPYALSRPLVDRLVGSVNRSRAASGQKEPPPYNSPWPMARAFFQESWKRGYDVKFGIAAVIMQAFCMAPISALTAVAMFYFLRRIFGSDRAAFWLALLYAFGTPAFFRTGYINHNLMLGEFAFMGFLAMWNPGRDTRWSMGLRYFLGGVTGGAALLFDYSGVVLLLSLFAYVLAQTWSGGFSQVFHGARNYILGTLGPVFLLWFYQWASFGNPFLPGQNWMPPVEWIDQGYQGFTLPQADILGELLFSPRYGLLLACPLFLLALTAPWWNRGRHRVLPSREMAVLLLVPFGLWLFCGGISYTRLQFNTGIRYLAPLFPFLFVPSALVLARLPRRLAWLLSVLAVAEAWPMAMYRDVETGPGVLNPVLHIIVGGFQLPILTVVHRMGGQFGDFTENGVSPLPVFVLLAAVLFGVWYRRFTETAAPKNTAAGERAAVAGSR